MDINSEARLAAMRKAKKRQEIRRRITPWLLLGILITMAVVFFGGKIRESISLKQENTGDSVIEVESITSEDTSGQEEQEEEAVQDEEVEIIGDGVLGPYAENYSEEKELFFDGYEVTGMTEAKPAPEEVMSDYAVLIDADEGTVVAAKDADIRIYPASMTKILTVLVAAEHVTDLDDLYMMDISITDYVYKHDCSAVGFSLGERVTVRDLMYGTILPSGADAALALAEYVAGSEELFVDMMNDKLEELGLSDTAHFTNCIGVYDDDHYCTLTDMAMIMKAAVENDLARQIMNTRIYTTSSTEEHPDGIEISNWFIRRIEDKDVHGKVMCAKTGFVNESGCCAASYQVSNEGKHYICVTGNAWSAWRCIYDHVAMYDAYTN
ncbi:D-alanyl-D-alanine carboxypeptidase (penicillin-binding protein 5/6) [Lachnospiraceae bacterium XBB2008]|nr:D-alanyl-D-alanine carboxypeptidase (penicillin-binding protein 5/6) [Lachnospiraceae bacterium XBB2008]